MSHTEGEVRARHRRRTRMVLPWVISGVLHAALIAVGFFVVWNVILPPKDPGPPAVVAFFDPAPAPAPDQPQDTLETPDTETPTEMTPVELELDVPELDELLAELEPAADAEPEPVTSPRDLMLERRYPEVEFYGQGAGNAESIVYVVDGSGSMVGSFPILKKELERSIRQLAPMQRFQVVFFQSDPASGRADATAAPHPSQPERTRETLLVRATRSNVDAVLDWIGSVRPSGRSNPIPALEQALALKPDAVFVLSNTITGAGEWEVDAPAILERLDSLNPAHPITGHRRVAIRTIQFLEEDPSGILRAIGVAHGGGIDGYTFISRQELGS